MKFAWFAVGLNLFSAAFSGTIVVYHVITGNYNWMISLNIIFVVTGLFMAWLSYRLVKKMEAMDYWY